ncbi:hypothetical protein LSS_20910 [Leptospira santarosai serovar Shermani str. LT 821]|uniref:Uncharacterized protein n=1 Tax=Leptospira santarosai serovar Shermani str. LT 821 TaxID=758847 RepID=A0A097ESA9_9LEPT|nr:hypothetical protein LSS_20910 [Leptospira santarosai serovar Shermani str. LT 821]
MFLPMGRNKMLALCVAKMNARTQRTPFYGSAFRSEIAKSREAETHCFFLWVETKCWFFA